MYYMYMYMCICAETLEVCSRLSGLAVQQNFVSNYTVDHLLAI